MHREQMKTISEIIGENEINLKEFIAYQIEFEPTNDFKRYAEVTVGPEDVYRCAALFYPKFILVENQVVLADHYSESNWKTWRESHSAQQTANVVNHVHIDGYLAQVEVNHPLEDGIGHILGLFWQMAVKDQFPEKNVTVEFHGDVIEILNQENA